MDEEVFSQLYESVRQMDEIAKGRRKPSRVYEFDDADVKAIREKTGLSQSQFALADWCEAQNASELGTGPTPTRWTCESVIENPANRSGRGNQGPA